MTKLTWLGDDACVWNEVTFPPGVPIEIADPYMLGKARNSPFFKVETDVNFFDDPPDLPSIMPETWTNTPVDVRDRQPLKRKRGRPPKVRADGDQ